MIPILQFNLKRIIQIDFKLFIWFWWPGWSAFPFVASVKYFFLFNNHPIAWQKWLSWLDSAIAANLNNWNIFFRKFYLLYTWKLLPMYQCLLLFRATWIAEGYHTQLWSSLHCAMAWAMSLSLSDNKLFSRPFHNIYAFFMIVFVFFWFDTFICLSILSCK